MIKIAYLYNIDEMSHINTVYFVTFPVAYEADVLVRAAGEVHLEVLGRGEYPAAVGVGARVGARAAVAPDLVARL